MEEKDTMVLKAIGERGNAVIEDTFGTGDGWNFSGWISGTLISEMRGLIQELGWLQFVSKITSL